jgi:hypothetical protein
MDPSRKRLLIEVVGATVAGNVMGGFIPEPTALAGSPPTDEQQLVLNQWGLQ